MKRLLRVALIAVGLVGALPASAQTAADVDASLDALYGDHKPYRHFFANFQKAVADNNKSAAAAMIDYPFQARIKGKAVKLRDAAHFVADYDQIITAKVRQAVAKQSYATLFANWQGVMVGDGEVWFSGVGSNNVVKVTAIND